LTDPDAAARAAATDGNGPNGDSFDASFTASTSPCSCATSSAVRPARYGASAEIGA